MKLGMGWLGWTQEDTERTTFAGIQLAYDARQDMLRAIFGSGERESAQELRKMKLKPATDEGLMAALDFLAGPKKEGGSRDRHSKTRDSGRYDRPKGGEKSP